MESTGTVSKNVPVQEAADKLALTAPYSVLAAFIIAATPLLFGLTSFDYTYQTTGFRVLGVPVIFAEIAVVTLACLGAVRSGTWKTPLNFAVIASLVGVALISLAVANMVAEFEMALSRAKINFIHLGLIWATAWFVTNGRDFGKMAVSGLAIGLIVFQIACFTALVTHPDISRLDLKFVGFGVTHARQLAFYGALSASLSLGLSLVAKQRSQQFYWAISASLGLAFIFWSGSRGGIFALAGLAAFAPLILMQRRAIIQLYGRLAAITPLAMLLSLIWVPDHRMWGLKRILRIAGENLGNPTADVITTNRTLLWREAIELIKQKPIFGYGEAEFVALAPSAYNYFVHPHNFILQFMVSWGIAGFVLATIAIATGLYLGVKAARFQDPVALPAYLGAVTLLIFGLIDSTLYQTFPLVSFALLLTIAAMRAAWMEAEKPKAEAEI